MHTVALVPDAGRQLAITSSELPSRSAQSQYCAKSSPVNRLGAEGTVSMPETDMQKPGWTETAKLDARRVIEPFVARLQKAPPSIRHPYCALEDGSRRA